jgi:hypothetical protein
MISHDEKSDISLLVNVSEEPARSPEADTIGRQKIRKLIRIQIFMTD